ncbi:MAG TPA: hypothetical protein VK957_20795 [Lunatimonas sp.]|nr:hypothetical protein [Lunatimonas sp.]
MKKGISILLLGCFLVYHFGFYIFYFAYQHHIESEWSAKVFDEQSFSMHVLEIPMRLPYMIDNEEFHLTNIPFSMDGKSYRGIKKRFINDAFQLVYVPDHAKINLELNLKQWVISLTPDGSTDQQKDTVLSKSPIKDYLSPSERLVFLSAIGNQAFCYSEHFSIYHAVDIQVTSPPPKVV